MRDITGIFQRTEKFSRSSLQVRKTDKPRQRVFMPKLEKKSSQLLPSCHHHVRLAVLKRFSAFRNFSDKLYVSNIKKEKKKQKRKVAFVTWKMP